MRSLHGVHDRYITVTDACSREGEERAKIQRYISGMARLVDGELCDSNDMR
jgi:hypothetical protein